MKRVRRRSFVFFVVTFYIFNVPCPVGSDGAFLISSARAQDYSQPFDVSQCTGTGTDTDPRCNQTSPAQRDQNAGSPVLRSFLKGAGYTAPSSDMTCTINSQGQEICVPSNDVRRYIVDIIRFVLTGVGFLFFALLVYAGYLWATAGGNDEAIKKAQSIATKAIIGFTLILAAYAITIFITSFLQKSIAA